MAEQLKNCFNDEVQQSQLLYGRDTQRIPAKIDFRNNIMPNLLKIYLQAETHPEHFEHALFYDTECCCHKGCLFSKIVWVVKA